MPRKIEITAYTVNELTPEIREEVLDKYRDINVDDSWYQPIIEGFDEDMEKYGISAKVQFTGFWSQGDGACFITDTVDTDLLVRKLHEEGYTIPEDCLLYSKDFSVRIAKSSASFSHRYEHENTIVAEVYNQGEEFPSMSDCIELENVITEWAREKSREVYSRLETYYEELTEDSAVMETLMENDYTFNQNGTYIPL